MTLPPPADPSLSVIDRPFALPATPATGSLPSPLELGLPVGVWECDMTRDLVQCSGDLGTILGLSGRASSISMDHWMGLLHPDDRPSLLKALHEPASTPAAASQQEFRLLHASGHYRRVRSSLAVVTRNAEQMPTRTVGTVEYLPEPPQETFASPQHEKLHRAIFHTVPIGLAVVGLDGRILLVNEALCELLGYAECELLNLELQSITHRHDLQIDLQLLQETLAGRRERYSIDKRYVAKDRSLIYARLDVTLLRDAAGAPLYFLSAVSDRTEERLRQQLIESQREMAQVTLSSIADGVVRVDDQRRITYANPMACQMAGLSAERIRQMPFDGCLSIDTANTAQATGDALNAVFTHGEILQFPTGTLLTFANGRQIAAECSAAPIKDALGHVREAVFVFHDTTESHAMARELAYQAGHDALTGLRNRRHFRTALRQAYEALLQSGTPSALLFIDLDGFKVVNDRHGHQAGDDVLIWVSDVIRSAVLMHDVPSRWGGDEFAVLLNGCDTERALAVARRIEIDITTVSQAKLSEYSGIGASIGLALMSPADANELVAVNNADHAASIAKSRGGGCIQRFEEIRAQIEARRSLLEWRAEIQQSLKDGRLLPFAQKIVDPERRTAGYEMLLRWVDASGRIHTPERLIDAAERLGWSMRIDGFVFDIACRTMLSGRYPADLYLTINISGKSLADGQFCDRVTNFYRQNPALASRLVIEITETAAVADLPSTGRFVSQLRDLGCRFALDDFGSGFASFSYLKAIPFSEVKIDRAYIRALERDVTNQLIVRNLCELAAHLNVGMIAEGVETEAEFTAARALGVTRFQGWLFQAAEPLPWFG